LTVFTDQFRSTNVGAKINDPKYPIDGIGSWISKHNPAGSYGFEWDTLLKQTLNDKVFAEEIAVESLVPDILPKSIANEKSLPIKSTPTQLPTVEPTPRETPSQQPVYFNTQSYQYYPDDVTDNRDVIRFRNGEYNYR
jgi:hypothetical protein